MTAVDQCCLDTVVNDQSFTTTVEFKDCPQVGRSLVAKKSLNPGDIVLIERPWLQYPLQPNCRSSLSPYFTQVVWNSITQIVAAEEEKLFGAPFFENISDDPVSEGSAESSVFCPGIPAAFLAYLTIEPPLSSHVRTVKEHRSADMDFFFYPENMLQHPTVRLIHRVAESVTETLPQLFGHLEAKALARFALRIYANAHTVAFQHLRNEPTHSSKRKRRIRYQSKWGEPSQGWPDERDKNRAMIALMSWGSKFAHACSPNMFLQFEPRDNIMVFTAVREIRQGELLTFSYLPEDDLSEGGLVCGTTSMRQAKLSQFKFFDCACNRCLDWDWSRGMNCPTCMSHRMYCKQSTWVCQTCKQDATDADMGPFLNQRESKVQKIATAIAPKVHGVKPMGNDMMGMIEPYLAKLLDSDGSTPVPKRHWTYGYIHSLLAAYHLKLFAQSFGQGLASQLGMTVSGLREAQIYLRGLHDTNWTHGSPMSAFFAGWRVLETVIDVVMETTQKRSYEPASQIADVDTDSDSGHDSDNDSEVAPQSLVGTEIIPLPDDYLEPVQAMAALVETHWLPLLKQVFSARPSAVMETVVPRIQAFIDRVATSASLSITVN